MTMTIATKRTVAIGWEYWSATDGAAVGADVGVAGASAMLKVVSASDGQ